MSTTSDRSGCPEITSEDMIAVKPYIEGFGYSCSLGHSGLAMCRWWAERTWLLGEGQPRNSFIIDTRFEKRWDKMIMGSRMQFMKTFRQNLSPIFQVNCLNNTTMVPVNALIAKINGSPN